MYSKPINIVGTNKGYEYFIDKEHPLATGNSFRVYVHRHIASIDRGYWLSTDEHVHHMDENKLNNDPTNLIVLSAEEHARIHLLERMGIDPNGYVVFTPYDSKCIYCQKNIIVKFRKAIGFCGNSCKNKYYYENKIPFKPPQSEIEIYKDVVGYETEFAISDIGNLFSKRTGNILKQTLTNGNPCHSTKIKVDNDYKDVCFKISRIMALAFIPNPENKPYVIHKDGDKLNNDLNNLMWATPKESSEITKKNNPVYRAKRDNAGNSKLTEDDVRYIRSVYIFQEVKNLEQEH